MDNEIQNSSIRILCRRLLIPLNKQQQGIQIQWLVGSPFFTPFTIVSTFRCIHTLPSNPLSPDFTKESNDIRMLLPKGFEVIGALVVKTDLDANNSAREAIDAVVKLRKSFNDNNSGSCIHNGELLGAVGDLNSGGSIQFFVSRDGNPHTIQNLSSIIYEDHPEKYIWQRGCLLQCELPVKLPVYYPTNSEKDVENMYIDAVEDVSCKLKDPQTTYILETKSEPLASEHRPIFIRGTELDLYEVPSESAQESGTKGLCCSYFCSKPEELTSLASVEESADRIQVSILSNRSRSSLKPVAPIAEYYPALKDAKLMVVNHKLEVLCYVAKDFLLASAISKLIIPALIDQLHSMRNKILPGLLTQHPQLHPYHFIPPGFLHPITVIYELNYGETEMKQVDARRSLHLRLGLPLDRPLLRIANSISLFARDGARGNSIHKGVLLKDVHLGIPSSGVSGGSVSLIQGSYEYHHYLQDGFDDSGWGCAYRSLQTIISWFRLQHYTGVSVPRHREIQQSLVEIGDKDPSFIGSREWIGAIELSFVLDKLLGVSCKVINVRSGAELPEKCRELALHFETQGTPVMIGGGVLAYTLLGVDYNETSGDCAFLILDPHYTGSDDLKKIVNGGWCGWKKAVDSKGKHFFLHDKFYNLLLPQRPDMV